MARKKKDLISIGPGRAVYPALKVPDTRFDENGMYKADIAIPREEAEPVIKRLVEAHKAHTGKAPNRTKNSMFEVEVDKDSGEETGNVIFKCRVKNRLNRAGELWDRRPSLFDASLRPIDVNPWGGTVYVVSAEIYCWDAGGKKGVSLQPQGVQILQLVEAGGMSAADMGFADMSDQYDPLGDDGEDEEDDLSDSTDDDDDEDEEGTGLDY